MFRRSVLAAALMLSFLGAPLVRSEPAKPTTVIHVVTVKWTPEATPEQIKKALGVVQTLNYPGLRRVWTKPIKMQLPEGYNQIIVMEFDSAQALEKYADSPQQKQWYEVYLPIRAESRTHDITN